MRVMLPAVLLSGLLLAACGGDTESTQGAANAESAANAPVQVQISADRAGLISLMKQYLSAMVAHQPAQLPIANNAVLVENAVALKAGEGLWQTASAVPDAFAIVVPDPVAGQVGLLAVMEESGLPVFVGIRLQVEQNKLVAMEHIVSRNLQPAQLEYFSQPRTGFMTELAASSRLGRDELLQIAYSYYDAVDLNDGSLAPFADDCLRRENGWQTSSKTEADAEPDDFTVFSMMGCAEQLDTNVMQYIDVIDNRRIHIADPQTGLVFGLSHFRHSMTEPANPIVGVEGVAVRNMSNAPFDLPAAHIFKIGADGKLHEIEATGVLLPYDSPTGWGW